MSVLALITFPPILNQIKKSKNSISKATNSLIFSAAGLYIDENQNTYGYIYGDTYCISLNTLIDNGFLVEPIMDSSNKELDYNMEVLGKVVANKKIEYSLVDAGRCVGNNTTPNIPDEPDLPGGIVDNIAPYIYGAEDIVLFTTDTIFNPKDGVTAIDNIDGDITSKLIIASSNVSLGVVGEYKIVYSISDSRGNTSTATRKVYVILKEIVYSYTGDYQTFTAQTPGKYKIELWGASGGAISSTLGGNGGYSSGIINLKYNSHYYVYIGGAGSGYSGGYNGGGSGYNKENQQVFFGYAGGGSTDIRYFTTASVTDDLIWNSSIGLNNRIIVAGGGGGAARYNGLYASGGDSGGINGLSGDYVHNNYPTIGGMQTAKNYSPGNRLSSFGFGQSSTSTSYSGAGGGGGYYGGVYSYDWQAGGGGGSSYISGYTGCVAITSELDQTPKTGCADGTTDITCSYHYSGMIFTDTVMKSGNESMPTYDGTSTMTGNSGNGYAKITYVGLD